MTAPESVHGLVLAGGRSRRMGRDKALLVADGQTQLERMVALLGERLSDVYVSARADQQDDDERAKFPLIVDRYDNLGPIAGILSAMDEHPGAAWLVVACDLPNIDAATIDYLLEHCSATQPATAYRSVRDQLPEPLCAIYRPSARAVIDSFVADGIVCPRKMLINSDTLLLEQPRPGALHNVNSPDDLAGTSLELMP